MECCDCDLRIWMTSEAREEDRVQSIQASEDFSRLRCQDCQVSYSSRGDCLHNDIFYFPGMIFNQLHPLLQEDSVGLQGLNARIDLHHFLDESTELLVLGLEDDL